MSRAETSAIPQPYPAVVFTHELCMALARLLDKASEVSQLVAGRHAGSWP